MDCLFCKIVAGDIPCEKLAESEHFVCFLDIRPITKGHALIAPKQHFDDVRQFPEQLAKDYFVFTKDISQKIVAAVNADGFNLSMNNGKAAGQIVFHQHTHIIPRFSDDGLKSWPHQESTKQEREDIAAMIR